jgi:hypothetical protein
MMGCTASSTTAQRRCHKPMQTSSAGSGGACWHGSLAMGNSWQWRTTSGACAAAVVHVSPLLLVTARACSAAGKRTQALVDACLPAWAVPSRCLPAVAVCRCGYACPTPHGQTCCAACCRSTQHSATPSNFDFYWIGYTRCAAGGLCMAAWAASHLGS